MKESPIEKYFLSDVDVEARSPGEIAFARGWRFRNVSVKSTGTATLRIRDSEDMEVDLQ
jgi:hypothetical protein